MGKEEKNYTNKELARAYFEVVGINKSDLALSQARNDCKFISEALNNLHEYYIKNGNLNKVEIPKISQKSRIGRNKRKLLERIIVEGKDKVKEERQEFSICMDSKNPTKFY